MLSLFNCCQDKTKRRNSGRIVAADLPDVTPPVHEANNKIRELPLINESFEIDRYKIAAAQDVARIELKITDKNEPNKFINITTKLPLSDVNFNLVEAYKRSTCSYHTIAETNMDFEEINALVEAIRLYNQPFQEQQEAQNMHDQKDKVFSKPVENPMRKTLTPNHW